MRRQKVALFCVFKTGLIRGLHAVFRIGPAGEIFAFVFSQCGLRRIGRVIPGQRDHVFLVSKVWPSHVAGNGIAHACEASFAAYPPSGLLSLSQ
jgi:hypothetical protein